jgi:pimeloyl-ACP methyl ester carboxylesterase
MNGGGAGDGLSARAAAAVLPLAGAGPPPVPPESPETKGAAPPFVVEVDEIVEQLAVEGERVRLHKQRLRLDGGLSVVRKHLPERHGPPVVLVHGFAQNRYTWHHSFRSFSAWLVARGFDVYNLELRGHGNSRSSGGAETFSDYVGDAERLAGVLGVPAFWVGHSLGGAVSYSLATRAPVRGVVGIGALFRFAQANRFLNGLCRISHVLRGKRILGNVNVRTRLAGQLLGRLYGITDIAGYAFPISGWAPGSVEPELLAERLEKGFDWTSVQVWLDMARWSFTDRFDFAEEWRQTDVPLLCISGDLDHLMPPADARAAFDESGSSDRTLLELEPWTTGLHWGHLDLISGTNAPTHVWTPILDWMGRR